MELAPGGVLFGEQLMKKFVIRKILNQTNCTRKLYILVLINLNQKDWFATKLQMLPTIPWNTLMREYPAASKSKGRDDPDNCTNTGGKIQIDPVLVW